MFPKNVQSTVLIGEPYKSKEKFTLFDSKIGGLPLWNALAPKEYPYHCSLCGNEMCLLLQLYEPTDDLDRVLYVFCCKSSVCQLSPKGWKCIRQQAAAKEVEEVKDSPKPTVSSGLSWSFNSSPSVSNSDLLNLLNQMEKKSPSAAPKAVPQASRSAGDAKRAVTPTGAHPSLPEWFVDVGVCGE